MKIKFEPDIVDVNRALDSIEQRAARVNVGGRTAGGAVETPGAGAPNARNVLGGATRSNVGGAGGRSISEAQSDARFRAQIAYDASTMHDDPFRLANTYNEAAASFERGSLDNIRYRTMANRASARGFAQEDRQFNQGIRELARQEARAIGRRSDAPEGFWGGEGGGGGGGGGTGTGAPAPGSGGGSWGRVGAFGLVQNALGLGGFGGGGGGGNRIFGINPYGGFGRYMSAGFLLRAASGSMEAGREYAVSSMLSGGNQEAELSAQMDYRQSIARSWGFIGQGVAFAQDPTGGGEAGVRATIQSVNVARSRMEFGRSQADFSRTLRNEYAVAKEHDPVQKQLEVVRGEEEAGRAAVTRRVQENADISGKEIEARKAELASTFEARLTAKTGYNWFRRAVEGDNADTINDRNVRTQMEKADADEIAGMRSTADKRGRDIRATGDAAVSGTAQERRTEILRNEGFRQDIMRAGFQGEEAVNAALVRGDQGAARVASIRAANREEELRAQQNRDPMLGEIQRAGMKRVTAAEAVNERERTLSLTDIREEAAAARNYDPGDPYGEARGAARRRGAAAARRDPRPGMAEAYKDAAEADVEKINAEEQYEKRYRRAELTAEKRGLEREVAGNFLAAQSGRRADAAREESSKLRERGDRVGADLVLGNAILEQKAERTRVLQSFEGREINVAQTALGGPRSGEDPSDLLKAIADEIKGLREDQQRGYTVPSVTD